MPAKSPPIYLLAPTEHDLHGIFTTRHIPYKVSSLPERHGCDVIGITAHGLIGYQRKTLPDLQASLLDGRLYKELAQLQATATVNYPFLVIESPLTRTIDGGIVGSTFGTGAIRSIIAKFAIHGVSTITTLDHADTVDAITTTVEYVASGKGFDIRRPKQLANEWGQVTSEAYAIFLLQSFPNIGPKAAQAIYEHFGGVPIQWTVTVEQLMEVPGIGRKTAEALITALNP